MKKTFVAYYRVSTKKQSVGLEAQQTTARQYAKQHDAEILAEFSERESGKHDNLQNRRELFAALDLCKRTGACLLIAKLDRLARDVEFTFHLKNSNANVVACDLPDFNTLTVGIFATMAQHERELCSQRTKAALAERKKSGVLLGSTNGKSHKYTDEDRTTAWRAHSEAAAANENSRKAWHFIEYRMKAPDFQTKNGKPNFASLARALETENYLTANGGVRWSSQQVQRLASRFGDI